jgi:hypothetical protein
MSKFVSREDGRQQGYQSQTESRLGPFNHTITSQSQSTGSSSKFKVEVPLKAFIVLPASIHPHLAVAPLAKEAEQAKFYVVKDKT